MLLYVLKARCTRSCLLIVRKRPLLLQLTQKPGRWNLQQTAWMAHASLLRQVNSFFSSCLLIEIIFKALYYLRRSVEESIVCEMECLRPPPIRNEHDSAADEGQIVDMCFVESLPFSNLPREQPNLNEMHSNNLNIMKNAWNGSYMHGMTWRWLPLGK